MFAIQIANVFHCVEHEEAAAGGSIDVIAIYVCLLLVVVGLIYSAMVTDRCGLQSPERWRVTTINVGEHVPEITAFADC